MVIKTIQLYLEVEKILQYLTKQMKIKIVIAIQDILISLQKTKFMEMKIQETILLALINLEYQKWKFLKLFNDLFIFIKFYDTKSKNIRILQKIIKINDEII